MAAKVPSYSRAGLKIFQEHCKNDLTYNFSLDELDISLSTISKLLRRREGEVVPLWDIDGCFREKEVYNNVEDEFCEFEISATRVADQDTKDSERMPYFCHICNIEIPKTCTNKHMQSDIHRTLLKLANTALERVNKHISQQIVLAIGNEEQPNKNLNMFYCVSCNLLMEERLKEKHEKQNEHKISIKKAQFINKLFEIYTEDIEKYDIHKENNKDTVIQTKKTLKTDKVTTNDKDIQNLLKSKAKDDIQYTMANSFGNCFLKSINIFKDYYLCDICQVKVPNTSQNITEHINGKSHISKIIEQNTSEKDIPEKFSVNKIEESNMLRENNKIIEKLNETIEIGTLSGDVIKISQMHWHGIAILRLNINDSFCKICEVEFPINLITTHIESKNHKEHLNAPIANKHGLRKISESNKMHCIVCNSRFIDMRQSLEDHVLTPEHHLFLEQALVYGGTKTQTDESNNLDTEENNEKTVSETYKINCDVCNIKVDKYIFNDHVNGKRHQRKIKTLQIRDKIINKTEADGLGTTAENVNNETKKETANYSRNPLGVVLKREKFKVIDLDEHNIEVTAMNGDVIRVNKDNWQSTIRMEIIPGKKHYDCQLCHYYEPIEQLEKHIRWSYHTNLIESPVPDKHCLRQNYHNEIYCTICRKTVFMEGYGSTDRSESRQQQLDDHISSVEHQDLLKKALVFSDDITKNNQTDKQNVSEENIGVSAGGTDIINCEICNIQLDSKNIFEIHVKGDKHQENTKKQQNRDKITIRTEDNGSGTTINSENMNVENKNKTANYSRNPQGVVLKKEKFKVIDIDEHNVEVTAINGDVIRVNKDNWHSTIRMEIIPGKKHYDCQLCHCFEPIEQLEKHTGKSYHTDLVESPVPDKHCLRQNYHNDIYCTICRKTVFIEGYGSTDRRESHQQELDDHILSLEHQDLLKKALVFSDDITTNNKTDKQHASEENIGVSASGEIINCEICNIQLDSKNIFEIHVKGDKHQENTKKLQNRDKVTNGTEGRKRIRRRKGKRTDAGSRSDPKYILSA